MVSIDTIDAGAPVVVHATAVISRRASSSADRLTGSSAVSAFSAYLLDQSKIDRRNPAVALLGELVAYPLAFIQAGKPEFCTAVM